MKNKNISTGINFGIVIGLVYVILLFWRWNEAENLIKFGVIASVAYLVVIGMMIFEAYTRRKQNEGFIEIKDLFQTLFISVLIFEFIYGFYNFIHLKYIDPEVINRMKVGMKELLEKAGENLPEAEREKSLSKFDELEKSTELVPIIKSYLTSIAMSGVFALIISLIFKKKKPIFQEIQ